MLAPSARLSQSAARLSQALLSSGCLIALSAKRRHSSASIAIGFFLAHHSDSAANHARMADGETERNSTIGHDELSK
ncbi:hypothetical protein BJS_08568 [Bradyrhizobium japonicum SEMIA 5079]|jgi:hypothetical protein|nr:hypothetical protein BJS_08568 [Bradyrhizobium japonicum SEMIA 5079]